MPYPMRLNRDVDDFKLGTDEEGDIILKCPHEGCTAAHVYLFGSPDMGTLIADAYKHLDDEHPDAGRLAGVHRGGTPAVLVPPPSPVPSAAVLPGISNEGNAVI